MAFDIIMTLQQVQIYARSQLLFIFDLRLAGLLAEQPHLALHMLILESTRSRR
jgi:hypothetical protein